MDYMCLGRLEEMNIFPLGILSLYHFPSHLLLFPFGQKNHTVYVFLALDNILLSSHCLTELSSFPTSLANFLVQCATVAATGPPPYFFFFFFF